MAHIGKNYPVHFRRDCNLGCKSNRVGYPKGFVIRTTPQPGLIGSNWNGRRFLCIAVNEDSLTELRWESEELNIVGRWVRCVCWLPISEVNEGPLVRWEFFDRIKGSICRGGAAVPGGGQRNNASGGLEVFYSPHPELWSGFAPSITLCDPILWPEWNSL